MNSLVESLLIFVVLMNLVLVGSSRLALCIRVLGFQGVALGLLPLCLPEHGLAVHAVLLAVIGIALKGFLFPWFLFRALRVAGVRHEVEPYVGYSLSIMGGVLTLGVSLWLGPRLNTVQPGAAPLALPTAMFTVLMGLFLIVSRKTALNQVIGYLVLENGIYLFGLLLAREQPVLVETGVLLDVFAAVFVMGIMVFHIGREFDHLDVDQLSNLKD